MVRKKEEKQSKLTTIDCYLTIEAEQKRVTLLSMCWRKWWGECSVLAMAHNHGWCLRTEALHCASCPNFINVSRRTLFICWNTPECAGRQKEKKKGPGWVVCWGYITFPILAVVKSWKHHVSKRLRIEIISQNIASGCVLARFFIFRVGLNLMWMMFIPSTQTYGAEDGTWSTKTYCTNLPPSDLYHAESLLSKAAGCLYSLIRHRGLSRQGYPSWPRRK